MQTPRRFAYILCGAILASSVRAEPPGVAYIFPAGGQRGTKVEFRVGGFYFHGRADFQMNGDGVKATRLVNETETVWFDGPMLLKPESQKKEDYPKDHLGDVSIDPNAAPGVRHWHCRTSQGTTPAMKFVVGELPEIVESEIDGAPIPQTVSLPVTINGRIFPREDVDRWRFHAEKGQTIACEVASRRLGYPLRGVLDVSAADGRPVAGIRRQIETSGDPTVSFTAPETGDYQVGIHDAGFDGGQNLVYRLTLRAGPRIESFYPLGGRRGETVRLQLAGPGTESRTVPVSLAGAAGDAAKRRVQFDGGTAETVTLHVNDLPEILEHEPNDAPDDSASPIALPAMLNGRIDRPGEVDVWPIDLEKGQGVLLEVLAEQLGSKLDSVLSIIGEDGKELARNDDRSDGRPDSRLLFSAAKMGRYFVRVADRFAGRGGPDFAYRLRITSNITADFELTLATDAFNVVRQREAAAESSAPEGKKRPAPKGTALRVDLVSLGALAKDVTLEVSGLPDGVTVDRAVITPKQKFADIRFNVPPQTPIQEARLSIRGTAEIDGKPVTRQATLPAAFGEPRIEHVHLAIVPPVPFKHIGQYLVVNDHTGGTALTKHYEIDRGGFEGPLTVRLSDRQGRCLQGVTGSDASVPPGATEFDYTVHYPSDVELGRTSRIQLMLVGDITDFDGTRHTVSYTSFENDNQMISVLSSGLLRITPDATSYSATPDSRVAVPVSIQRDPSLAGRPVRLELLVPKHIIGVTARPVEVPAGRDAGSLTIEFGGQIGPFNMPVRIVARTTGDPSAAHFTEARVELVSPPKTPAQ